MANPRLAGQVAWISGASSGIGAATARLLAAEGARVTIAGLNQEASESVAAEIRSRGGEALGLRCDVTREDEVRASIERTVAAYGNLQIMVNNAGVVQVALLHEYSEADWDYLMAVNVKSIMFSTKHAWSHLRRNRRSYMVNVGSISSFVGQAKTPAYTASKHAVLGLSRSIALDYASEGLRCNCVSPGITDTPMLRTHLETQPDPEAALAKRLERVPMGIALRPEDVARSILFLCCEDSAGVTGTSLTIDCGYLAAAEWESGGTDGLQGAAMPFELACADFTFPLLAHEHVLDLISMLGFDGVDIGLFEGRSHLQPSREFRQVDRAAKQLRGRLSDHGLAAADVFLQMAPDFREFAVNHPLAPRRRRARDWFLRTLDYAAGCGARHVTTLPGVLFADEPRAASWGRMCDELAWRLDRARPLGIQFSVEAHFGSIAPSPAQAKKLIEDVPGLTLTLDYTHFTRQGRPDEEIEPLLSFASHFHVRGAARGLLQTSFDENIIDYGRVCRQLQAMNYRGYLGIEYVWTEWEHCNRVDNLSETIRWRDYFRSLPKAEA